MRTRGKEGRISLFLDSGAYSAWSKGIKIDIDEYISFIKKNQEWIDVYACLDVIGDPEQTYKNQKYMESKGLHPIITFHHREPYDWLRKYVDEYSFIALGGVAKIARGTERGVLRQHFDNCFGIICGDDGMPKVKVHGFGMTSLDLIIRYPWYSCDSTSWVMTSRMGSVFVPRFKGGKWVYDENSWKVAVSSRSSNKEEEGQHFDTFTPEVQKVILNYFEEKGYKVGKSEFRKEKLPYKLKKEERFHEEEVGGEREVETKIEEGLCNSYRLRDEMNIIYFLDLESSLPSWPWPFKRSKKGFGLI